MHLRNVLGMYKYFARRGWARKLNDKGGDPMPKTEKNNLPRYIREEHDARLGADEQQTFEDLTKDLDVKVSITDRIRERPKTVLKPASRAVPPKITTNKHAKTRTPRFKQPVIIVSLLAVIAAIGTAVYLTPLKQPVKMAAEGLGLVAPAPQKAPSLAETPAPEGKADPASKAEPKAKAQPTGKTKTPSATRPGPGSGLPAPSHRPTKPSGNNNGTTSGGTVPNLGPDRTGWDYQGEGGTKSTKDPDSSYAGEGQRDGGSSNEMNPEDGVSPANDGENAGTFE